MSDLPSPRIYALIPCGGVGARAGEGLPKQYRPIAGRAMVQHTLAAFATIPRLQKLVAVIAPDDALFADHVQLPIATFFVASCAGNTRARTVFHGLNALCEQGAEARDWVLVHDAARCLITPELINRVIDACWQDPIGGLLALRLPDTLKQETSEPKGRASATVDRADKWLAQTPQMFRIGELQAALQLALQSADAQVTDEASALEAIGKHPLLVPGSAQNFKVTYPEDFVVAEAVLNSRTA